MQTRFRKLMILGGVTVVLMAIALAAIRTGGQTPAASNALPRTPVGKPDLNGIWQALNTANWDIQDHSARQGPVFGLGAAFSIPAGKGVVEGNESPYQPWAAQQKKTYAAGWMKLNPEIKCYLPGVPRATY